MAKIEKIIPFIIEWESGLKDGSVGNEALFQRACAKGIVNDPADSGGATLVGVTIGTYKEYCRRKGKGIPTVFDLSNLSYEEWLDILKTMFWDRWQADRIVDGRVAHMLVDWVWTSGSYGITIPQKTLGVKVDGIVGSETLIAVNSRDPQELFLTLKSERIAYIDRICKRRPANFSFRCGWLRRINAL